jgi:hypothetical protein
VIYPEYAIKSRKNRGGLVHSIISSTYCLMGKSGPGVHLSPNPVHDLPDEINKILIQWYLNADIPLSALHDTLCAPENPCQEFMDNIFKKIN